MNVSVNANKNNYLSIIVFTLVGFFMLVGLQGCFHDDDDPIIVPVVTFTDVAVLEGDTGTTNLVFTASLDKATSIATSIDYSTVDGTASAGSDYVAITDTLEIAAGATSASITVTVNTDTDLEPNETLTINLTNPAGVTLAVTSVTGSITNDDNANPDGYFTGTASVKENDNVTDLSITDLQGIVSGTRFMLISVSNGLLYDGIFTDITETDYTATVRIYKDGSLVAGNTTATGTITSASSITGAFIGDAAGNGSFSLTYSLNNEASNSIQIGQEFQGPINFLTLGANLSTLFVVDSEGLISGTISNITSVLGSCDMSTSTVIPVTGINVYDMNMTLSNCADSNVNGQYTGFAATETVEVRSSIYIAFTNGSFSGSGLIPTD